MKKIFKKKKKKVIKIYNNRKNRINNFNLKRLLMR